MALGCRPRCGMGGSASKPEDIVRIAKEDAPFNPPLGPPNPVRSRAYHCTAQVAASDSVNKSDVHA